VFEGDFLSYIRTMAISIRGLSGPLKDRIFVVRDGLKIGRTKGDIVLKDNKVSSLHAYVGQEGGNLALIDNGSKNGLRLNGARVSSVPLLLGVKFEIGDSLFEVIESEGAGAEAPSGPQTVSASVTKESGTQTTAEPPTAPPPVEEPATKPEDSRPTQELPAARTEPMEDPDEEVQARRWSDILIEFLDQNFDLFADQPKAIVALTPAVRLTFIGGPQTETIWTLGYGPRRAGAASIDLPIQESDAPDICFEILPSPEGVTFRTSHPNKITLNGQGRTTQSLKSGDVIGIGSTRIEVELLP